MHAFILAPETPDTYNHFLMIAHETLTLYPLLGLDKARLLIPHNLSLQIQKTYEK